MPVKWLYNQVCLLANKRFIGVLLISTLTLVLTAAPSAQVGAAPLKVMSYNIHHGEGTDMRFDLPGIADLIRSAGADIVGLQEVDQRTSRSMLVDQGAEIARLLGFKYVYTPHFPYKGGNYGLALVSRYPIAAHKSHPLPTAPGVEAKSMLQATVNVDGNMVNVFVIHFEVSNETVRQAQADAAAAIIARSQYPAILMGDFNAMPESLVMVPFRHFMLDSHIAARFLAPASHMQKDPVFQRTYIGGGATFPAEAPRNRADLIWTTKEWRPASGVPVQSIPSKRSDHTAVVATLELTTQLPQAMQLPGTWSAATEAAVFMSANNAAWLQSSGVNSTDVGNALVDWLTQAGLKAKVVDDVAELPPGGLVLLPGGRYLTANETAALQAHVLAGGALVAWGDAGVESVAETGTAASSVVNESTAAPQSGAVAQLADLLGIKYMGWSMGFPTRGQLTVDPEVMKKTGFPGVTRFWRMEGPVLQVLPGVQVLGYWKDARGEKASHPMQISAGLTQNGRAMYLGFNALQLNDKENPDVKALFNAVVRYLAAEKAVESSGNTQAPAPAQAPTLDAQQLAK